MVSISYTPSNGYDQMVISPTQGGVYLAQPLTRIGVPNKLTVCLFTTIILLKLAR